MICERLDSKSAHAILFTMLVLLNMMTPPVMTASYCVPTPPCRQCDYVTIERDDYDCNRYYYCYLGRLWTKMRCGFQQIYSLKVRACVYKFMTDECDEISNDYDEAPPTYSPSSSAPPIRAIISPTRQPSKTISQQLADAQCGIKATSHIVGGASADQGEWAWQVSLKAYSSTLRDYVHFCGGSLVHESWVVTAAHCVFGHSRLSMMVIVGAFNLSKPSPDEQKRYIATIVIHKDFRNYGNFPNDIALLRLSSPVSMSRSVGTVCLPPQGERAEDLKLELKTDGCWVTGWGHTLGTANIYSLNELSLQLVDHALCASQWAGYIQDVHLCAGTGDTGSCKGDSGGPLVCTKKGRYFLQGVVSWGEDTCTVKGFPNVFTRVSLFTDWIQQMISTR